MVRLPIRPLSLPVQAQDIPLAMALDPRAPSWALEERELGLPRKNLEAGYFPNGMCGIAI